MAAEHLRGKKYMNAGAAIFLDTNILVYLHDASEGEKHIRAKEIVNRYILVPDMILVSVQVLQEFYTTMIRKGGNPLFFREVVEYYMLGTVITNSCELMRRALDIQEKFQLSFWDANIVAAAQAAGARELWTEDLNDGQDYGGVTAVNPFKLKNNL